MELSIFACHEIFEAGITTCIIHRYRIGDIHRRDGRGHGGNPDKVRTQLGDRSWGCADIINTNPPESSSPGNPLLLPPSYLAVLTMSPAKLATEVLASFPETDLHIMGIASNYPESVCTTQDFRDFCLRNYPRTPA